MSWLFNVFQCGIVPGHEKMPCILFRIRSDSEGEIQMIYSWDFDLGKNVEIILSLRWEIVPGT